MVGSLLVTRKPEQSQLVVMTPALSKRGAPAR
jgi:hypothetical protein